MKIDTTNYMANMNSKPYGTGHWIFRIANVVFWFEFMSYAEAKKIAVRKARELKTNEIFLMP